MRNSHLLIVLVLLLAPAAWSQTPSPASRDVASDTWVATDGLGRSVPTEKETGLPRRNKTVGIFYFLTFDHSQDALYDNTEILKAHPEAATDIHNPAWGPLNSTHYWGEPLFGYYASDDEWVLRKHAQMLSDAGVDVVIFDNSNTVTYDKARNTLCRIWEDVRRKGGRTPQIAFLCPFSNGNNIGGSTLREIYDTLYKPGLYNDLWFRWEGKPLVLADPSYADTVPAEGPALRSFFTFRTPIAPYNIKSPPPGQWAWLQIYPQAPQLSPTGTPEQISVGVAQNYNADVNRTAPMSFPGAFGRAYHDGKLDTSPDAEAQGYNFQEQWNRALKIDPPFVFVTGWNEWTMGFYDNWAGFQGRPIFVDEYTAGFSRDTEPMTGGFGDDYYYQLVSNIRRYKGTRPIPPIVPRLIPWNGSFDGWQHITPEFRDDIGDAVHRDADGTGKGLHYVNNSGRNDIVAAKVSYDAKNIYFYVRTDAKLTPYTDKDWMLLYLNTDGNCKTGWLGYDFVVNRQVGAKTTSLEKNIGGKYAWKPVGEVKYEVSGSQLVVAIPRKLLGATVLKSIDFKWADHCFAKGDWTDFTLNGDAAPNDRFNYRAVMNRE
jgi:hypothetical protein